MDRSRATRCADNFGHNGRAILTKISLNSFPSLSGSWRCLGMVDMVPVLLYVYCVYALDWSEVVNELKMRVWYGCRQKDGGLGSSDLCVTWLLSVVICILKHGSWASVWLPYLVLRTMHDPGQVTQPSTIEYMKHIERLSTLSLTCCYMFRCTKHDLSVHPRGVEDSRNHRRDRGHYACTR